MRIPQIVRSESNTGEYYTLLPEPQSLSERIKKTFIYVLMRPIRTLQYLIGRPLSYFILNPLFRPIERFKSIFAQNKKYPDPKLSEEDDMVVLNVVPERHIIIRIIKNWIYLLRQRAFQIPFFSRWMPNPERARNASTQTHLNQIKEEVRTIIAKGPLKAAQIYFKGLEHLLPTQRAQFFIDLNTEHAHDFSTHADQYHFFTLKTADDAVLDSVEVRPTDHTKEEPIGNRKFIVNCLPRSNNYHDWIKQNRYFSAQLNATIIGFNYRGIGLSRGIVVTQNDMLDDTLSQIYRLLALGAKPENIGLMGECLGANIATRAAAELHKNGCPVDIFNARSFRSMPAMLLARARPAKQATLKNPLTCLRWIATGIVRCVINPLLYVVGWDLSVDDAYRNIPSKNKGFLCVRSKKNETGERFKDDLMVPHRKASIYSLLKEEQQEIRNKRDRNEVLSEEESIRMNDLIKSHQFYVSPTLRADAAKTDGHTCQARYLTHTDPDDKTDAREYAIGFFKKVWKMPQSDPNPLDQMTMTTGA